MQQKAVRAPVSLLTAPELTPAAKVLWLAVRLQPKSESPVRLAADSGLVPRTVRTALEQLTSAGWYTASGGAVERSPAGKQVPIPAGLLAEPEVRPQGKLLYGILQTVPGGECSYATLSAQAGVSVVTVRQAIRELAAAGWIQIEQANQLAPVRFTLRNPVLERSAAEVEQAAVRLKEWEFTGEAIMREYLSLIVDSDEFEDNARPGWLVNPGTKERLELDRYYPPSVAFEYHGPQHFRTTKKYPKTHKLANQQARDLITEALCARRGVKLIVIQWHDLNLKTMQEKVGALLPLRDLRPHQALIEYLEKRSW